MKRLILCLLALCLCLCIFVGCKQDKEEVPKGFQIATCAGESFRLYIPSTWNSTVNYGISGGYYNLSTTSTVRLMEYTRSDDVSAEAFYAASLRPALLALASKLAEKEAPAATLLGSLNAVRYHERGTVSGKALHFVTYVGTAKEAFYVLSFTIADSAYDTLLADMENIAEVFTLADPYAGTGEAARKPNAKIESPAGMKLVSSDDVSYRFFVPEAWEYDATLSISEAHNQANTANLSVVPYLPDESMSVSEFLSKQNEQLVTAYGENYTKLDESEGKLGARLATIVESRILNSGETYLVREYVTAYKGMIYSFTYTATEEAYALYLADAGQAASAFTFR